jgi:ABC-type polysaccharide/polyol phosphate transport system ATPase subunit
VDLVDLEVAFAWASIAPDLPIAVAAQRLPEEALVAGASLTGTSSPIPTDTGHVGVRARLVDPRAGTSFDEAATEFWIAREVVGRRPQLAVELQWSLREAEEGEATATSAEVADAHGAVAVMRGASKRFRSGDRPRVDRRLLPGAWGDDRGGDLVAVDDVFLVLRAGTSTGIIGPNGAGKTTLLRLLAGTTSATAGRVTTRGRVVSMLELGLGFHPDLAGRDNVDLAARLLGLGPHQLRDRFDEILDFAGLGEAIDAPVKQYSSGMRARLGLAVAVHAGPDLLLIDEALAVGDEGFRTRAIREVDRLRNAGTAVVFVSHDLDLVEEVCERVIRLERGRVVADGPTDEVLEHERSDGDGGTTRLTTAVELGPLQLVRRRVVSGGRLELDGQVDVTATAPWLRLELRYQARTAEESMTPEEAAAHTIFTRVLEPAGGALGTPGRFRFHAIVDGNDIAGDVVVHVTAVDEREEQVVAESWQAVTFGNPRPGTLTPVSCPVDVVWTSR